MHYAFAFLSAFVLAIILTFLVRKIALKYQILDYPEGAPERKIQKKPTPLLGGLAIFLSFFLALGIFTFFTDRILGYSVPLKNLIGVFVGGVFLMIGGFLDDKYNIKPHYQVIWPVLAIIAVIISGIGVKYITNPFGGLIYFSTYKFEVFRLGGMPYYITLFSDIFTFIWLIVLMYTTKFLDGLDGLVPGISVIGGLIVAGLCLVTKFFQPEIATISLIFAGACLGFLLFSFHPAKIFLGEGGSLFCGFMLGVLAIISGGKIATTLLVLGIPILDLIWVMLRRVISERRAPWLADKKHLHFRLLDIGFSHRQAVLFLYFIALCFGATTLFLQSFQKLIALAVLIVVMLVLAMIITRQQSKNIYG